MDRRPALLLLPAAVALAAAAAPVRDFGRCLDPDAGAVRRHEAARVRAVVAGVHGDGRIEADQLTCRHRLNLVVANGAPGATRLRVAFVAAYNRYIRRGRMMAVTATLAGRLRPARAGDGPAAATLEVATVGPPAVLLPRAPSIRAPSR